MFHICIPPVPMIFFVCSAWLFISGCSMSLSFSIQSNDREMTKPMAEMNIVSPLVQEARKQIGVVTEYDTGYYVGGYPPQGKGACTDVIETALRGVGYTLKEKIDADMKKNSTLYPHASDPNINFRRVRNVRIFLSRFAESKSLCVEKSCLASPEWQPGDIVTFDQIPGSLWHIAIVSDKKEDGVPLLIHNYGYGVVEDNLLLDWPAPLTGHFRLSL